jgi:hypothetical protein
MFNILYKEFVVQRTVILAYAVVAILFITQLIRVDGPMAVISMLAMFFTFGTAAHEDKNNSHVLLNSLPVARKEIVTAKYVFHIAFGICLVGLTFIYRTIIGALPKDAAMWQYVIAVTVIVWFVSVFFPMYFWLGPRFVQIGMIVLLIVMFTAVPMVYNLGVKHNFWGIPDFIQSLPRFLLFVFATAVTIVFLIVSRLISVRLYERKQF